ncbi:MAG TPA: DNA mismatch repair endonuclease MutL [Firmicutes bacterium]|nr:DNA mismatch repair endonuclease MutL [Bacillota bacterium]
MRAQTRPIQVLPSDLANKIAAGEVVERPASVVKELVENAIDAGATKIGIEVRDGGKEYIRVTDNGRGVAKDQLLVAFLRHATNKIASVEDLTTVLSLGFRGEALPSIASCSEVEFSSCPEGAEPARIVVRGGIAEPVTAAAGAPGTDVVVRRLFYNTPARYKFLKQSATEKRYIAEFVTNIALAHPEIAFRLTGDNALMLSTPGTSDLLAAISAIHGAQIAKQMIPVNWESPFAVISGYISPPNENRSTRALETVFVNGRWVQNRLLYSAIERGYDTMLPARRYPIAVLHLKIDPSMIDVNVHPAKAEIRFRNDAETYKNVMLAVKGALSGANLIPTAKPKPEPDPQYQPRAYGFETTTGYATTHADTARYLSGRSAPALFTAEVPPIAEAGSSAAAPCSNAPVAAACDLPIDSMDSVGDEDLLAHMRQPLSVDRGFDNPTEAAAVREFLRQAAVLGQVLNTYLVVTVPFGLWLIDQHVAHERVLYEQVLTRPVQSDSQMLLVPITIQLTPAEAAAVEGLIDPLAELGLVLEPFGTTTFLVRSIPLQMKNQPMAASLRELLVEITQAWEGAGPTRRERAAAMIACKAAVKAGQRLESSAQQALLRSLAGAQNPFACPHGRPVMIAIDQEELEKRFGRRK